MLKILEPKEVWWPVRMPVPKEGGQWDTLRGEVLVRYPLSRTMLAEAASNGLEAIAALVLGWRGEAFEGAEFSREALLAVLEIPSLNGAIQQALLEVALGRPAQKNSVPGSASSSA